MIGHALTAPVEERRSVSAGDGPDLGMVLTRSVQPSGRQMLELRCGACESAGGKGHVWVWREPLAGLVSVSSVARAHRLERHGGEAS